MNSPEYQNPSSGGSYMRNADGTLTRISEDGQPIDDEGKVIASMPAEIAPAESAAPKPARAARAFDPALTEKEI